MPVEDKVTEARFFLEKLSTEMAGSTGYRHYLTAFLGSAWGIPDWLLQEYAGKYFGLTLDDKVNEVAFKFAAKVKGDPEPRRFIQWYSGQKNRLLNEEPGMTLHRKRVDVIHRGGAPVFNVQLFVPVSISVGASVSLNSSGSFLASSGPPTVVQPTTTRVAEPSSEVFFSEHPEETVNSQCQRLLQRLENLVQEARRQFP